VRTGARATANSTATSMPCTMSHYRLPMRCTDTQYMTFRQRRLRSCP
jgi:hypothetical protein